MSSKVYNGHPNRLAGSKKSSTKLLVSTNENLRSMSGPPIDSIPQYQTNQERPLARNDSSHHRPHHNYVISPNSSNQHENNQLFHQPHVPNYPKGSSPDGWNQKRYESIETINSTSNNNHLPEVYHRKVTNPSSDSNYSNTSYNNNASTQQPLQQVNNSYYNSNAFVNPSPRNAQALRQSSQASLASPQSTPYKSLSTTSTPQHYPNTNISTGNSIVTPLAMNHLFANPAGTGGVSSSQSSPISPNSVGSNQSTHSLPLGKTPTPSNSITNNANNNSNTNSNTSIRNAIPRSSSKLSLPSATSNNNNPHHNHNNNSNSTGQILSLSTATSSSTVNSTNHNNNNNNNMPQIVASSSRLSNLSSNNTSSLASISSNFSSLPTSTVPSNCSSTSTIFTNLSCSPSYATLPATNSTTTTSIIAENNSIIPVPCPTISDISELHSRYIEIGLENLGNTCFMNSILQCLVHIPALLVYFLVTPDQMEYDLNPKSPTKGILAKSFHQLLSQMVYGKANNNNNNNANNNNSNVIAPTEFQRAVGAFAPYLMDFQQQDSQEFLRFLLDGMSEDLCRRHHQQHLQQQQQAISNSGSKKMSSNEVKSAESIPEERIVYTIEYLGSRLLPILPQLQALELQLNISKRHLLGSGIKGIAETGSDELMIEADDTRMRKGSVEGNNEGNDGEVSQPPSTPVVQCKLRVIKDVVSSRGSNQALKTMDDVGGGGDHAAADPLASTLHSTSSDNNNGSLQNTPRKPSTATSTFAQIRDVLTGKTPIRLRKGTANSNANSTSTTPQSSVHQPNGSHFFSNTFSSTSGSSSNSNQPNDDQSVNNNGTTTGMDSNNLHPNNDASSSPSNDYQKQLFQIAKEGNQAWDRYLQWNDSIITDIFGGLLQSTIQCSVCQHRSFSFDPFLDLSVSIDSNTNNQSSSSFGSTGRGILQSIRQAATGSGGGSTTNHNNSDTHSSKCTLEKCLEKFTGDEILDGDDMIQCEHCKTKRKCIKRLSVFRYPKILVVHMKRFRFTHVSREKLSTDVHVPSHGLDLLPYLSPDMLQLANMYCTSSLLTTVITPHNNHQHNSHKPSNQLSEPQETSPLSSPHHQQQQQPEAVGDEEDPATNHPTTPGGRSSSQHSSGSSSSSNSDRPQTHHRNYQYQHLMHPVYDLVSVSNHHGTLHGGHYIAHVDTSVTRPVGSNTNNGNTANNRWICFNDARVSYANNSSIVGPTAYILFYKLREPSH